MLLPGGRFRGNFQFKPVCLSAGRQLGMDLAQLRAGAYLVNHNFLIYNVFQFLDTLKRNASPIIFVLGLVVAFAELCKLQLERWSREAPAVPSPPPHVQPNFDDSKPGYPTEAAGYSRDFGG
jgi:hypothetical protein